MREQGGLFTEYHMRPMARLGLLVSIGTLPMIAAIFCAYGMFVGRSSGWHSLLIFGILVVLLVVPLILVCRWRLRITEDGIFIRSLVRWDIWTWSEFAAGNVRHGPNYYSFTFPDVSSKPRILDFSILSAADAECVLETCRSRWVRPSTSELPGEVRVRLGIFRLVTFDHSGVVVSKLGYRRRYRWQDVTTAEIFLPGHDIGNCDAIRLRIGKRTLMLRFTGVTYGPFSYPDYPATSEIAARIVERRVDPGKTFVFVTQEASGRVQDTLAQFELLNLDRRSFRVKSGLVGIPLLLAFGRSIWTDISLLRTEWFSRNPESSAGLLHAALVFVILLAGLIFHYCYREYDFHRREVDIRNRRDSM